MHKYSKIDRGKRDQKVLQSRLHKLRHEMEIEMIRHRKFRTMARKKLKEMRKFCEHFQAVRDTGCRTLCIWRCPDCGAHWTTDMPAGANS